MITAEIKLQLSPSTQCESTHSDETMPSVIRNKLGHELMSQAGIPPINYSSKSDTITVKNFNSLILCLLERSIKLATRPLQQYRSVKYATEDRQSLPQ